MNFTDAGERQFRFAVISDTHFRLPSGSDEGGYDSNRQASPRNRLVVECLNRLGTDFVIHLGDIVHPIPLLPGHAEAVRVARDIFAELDAELFALPGNHDVGDKPNAWMPAPVVDEANHEAFERHWGASYRSFDRGDCHFVLLDSPVFNSNLKREEVQRRWLESDLAANAAAGRRLFVFLHYPPFLLEPGEASHYDNMDEPARSWLLNVLTEHGAEAVFAGHVHNFFYNRHGGTAHYVAPSTAFVRPEYADLAAVAPAGEFGRDDRAKLGFLVVDVFERGHAVDAVRTFGGFVPDHHTASRLGVSLRHPWAEPVELPTDGLDEFRRKRARRDGIVQALWELRIGRLRVPAGDLASAAGRARMADLAARGHTFTVYSAGVPDDAVIRLMEDARDVVAIWEVLVPADLFPEAVGRIAAMRRRIPIPVHLAPIVPMIPEESQGPTFQHFASHGFSPVGDESLACLLDLPEFAEAVDGICFRVSPFERPWDGIAAIAGRVPPDGFAVSVNLQMPRIDEGIAATNDMAAADHIAEAVLAAAAFPHLAVYIDTYIDHDRGYYPRNGLVDRRTNPRPAFHALKNLEAVLPGSETLEVTATNGGFPVTAGTFHAVLVPSDSREENGWQGKVPLRSIDLVSGGESPAGGPRLLVFSE